MKRRVAIGLAFSFVTPAGCAGAPAGGGPSRGAHPGTSIVAAEPTVEIAVPKLGAAPTEPRELPGVDVSRLDERERRIWWRLASQLYAPCSEQAISVAQCVEEGRPCAACAPAASFLAERLARGDAGNSVEIAYSLRFAQPRPIDLRDSPSRGPVGAPVTIVEWFDFQCPACRFTAPLIDEAIAKNPGKVRLVHKFYPLRSHQHAEPAARAAYAAMVQGKYWEMGKLLFEGQSELEPENFLRFAKELKLEVGRFKADSASDKAALWIARDKADADALNLDGTPFIWVNGRSFDSEHFRIDKDLDAWIKLDASIATAAPPAPRAAASAPAPPLAASAAPIAGPAAR